MEQFMHRSLMVERGLERLLGRGVLPLRVLGKVESGGSEFFLIIVDIDHAALTEEGLVGQGVGPLEHTRESTGTSDEWSSISVRF